MLVYVSSGTRAFGRYPVSPYARDCWEFYAALRGRVAPVDAKGESPAPARETLWAFAPGHVHGWRGEHGRPAGVAVFHFRRAPAELAERVAAAGGALSVPINRARSRRIVVLAHELQPLLWRGGEFAGLRAERAMLELALMMLEPPEPGRSIVGEGRGGRDEAEARVSAAERWFRERLEAPPNLVGIACRLGVSPGQMRRLFIATRGVPPKAAFERIRLARAEELLRGTDLKLAAVAAMSGYASGSAFAQAFRRALGTTPDAWRRASRGKNAPSPCIPIGQA